MVSESPGISRPATPAWIDHAIWWQVYPLGATGARLMTTLLHELDRTGGRYGLQTMCEGGGTANATLIELL